MDVADGQRNVRLADNAYRTPNDRVALEWQGRAFTSLKQWLAETGQSAAAGD